MSLVRASATELPYRDHVARLAITSPPYLRQRVYGDHVDEIGTEESVKAYCAQMVWAAREVRRVLVDDKDPRGPGIYMLNMGDKSNGSGGAGGDYNKGGAKAVTHRKFGHFRDTDFEIGQFLDVPGKVLTALQDDGWRLRQYIIWDKGQESRESLDHVNRPRTSHEVIFMLAPCKGRSVWRPEWLPETGSVWHFPPAQRERKQHQAPFPDEIVMRSVMALTEPGDLVIDPFVGSGTTTRVSSELGRRASGVDLYAGVSADEVAA